MYACLYFIFDDISCHLCKVGKCFPEAHSVRQFVTGSGFVSASGISECNRNYLMECITAIFIGV